jgi:uncharacterized membrane protein YgcG
LNESFETILDQALSRENAGRSRQLVLQDFPGHGKRLDPLLNTASILVCLKPVPQPDAAAQQDDRRQFLQALNQFERKTVSPGLVDRINQWIAAVFLSTALKPKLPFQEKRKMSAIFVNITLMFALLIASAGGTMAAATQSLPDSPLYPLKLAVEQVQVDLLADPEEIASRYLVMAENRSEEILHQAQQGRPVQDGTNLRLQEHLGTALQYTARLGEAEMASILTRAQQMIHNQLQEMEQTRLQLKLHQQDPLAEPVRILQQTQARVQAGLEDPVAFREQARYGFGEVGGNPDCPLGECLPTGDSHRYRYLRGNLQLRFSRTRVRNSQTSGDLPLNADQQSGSEECPNESCIPIGDEHHYGQESESGSAGPGQPGGNPDPDCDDCEPSGDENKYGQQPDQPGSGEPGGNPGCTDTDCDPEGDQHQEGQPSDSGEGGGTGGGSDPSSGNGDSGGSGSSEQGSGGQSGPGHP